MWLPYVWDTLPGLYFTCIVNKLNYNVCPEHCQIIQTRDFKNFAYEVTNPTVLFLGLYHSVVISLQTDAAGYTSSSYTENQASVFDQDYVTYLPSYNANQMISWQAQDGHKKPVWICAFFNYQFCGSVKVCVIMWCNCACYLWIRENTIKLSPVT